MARVNLEINGKDNASVAIKGVTSSIITAQIAFKGIEMAIGFVTDIAKKSIEAFTQQEAAVVSLQTAVGGNTKELENYASKMQRVTNVSDEAVMEIMKLGSTMGISKDNLDDASKGAIGLSEAFGIDLNTSMKMVAQTNQGQFTMLQRYIPELRNATTESEKMDIVNRKMADGFDIAKAKTNTFGGSLKAFENTTDDLMEIFGQLISSIGKDMVQAMNSMVQMIIDFLKTENGIKIMAKTFATLGTAVSFVVNTIKTLFDFIWTTIKTLITFGTVVKEAVTGNFEGASKAIKDTAKDIQGFADRTGKNANEVVNSFGKIESQVTNAFQNLGISVNKTNAGIIDNTNETISQISEGWKSIETGTGAVFGSLSAISDQYYSNELTNAEGNVEKQKQLKKEQFTANKSIAIVDSIINTASAVIAALNPATYPPPSNFLMAGIIGGLGAIQTGLIAAQPMPAFARGGVSTGGMALVGEQGPELVNLPSGSRVFSNSESQNMMGINIASVNVYPRDVEDFTKQLRFIARTEASRA